MSNKYLLKGDVSGIQEFIFNVSSKKAAKSLKARSFYIQVIGELAFRFVQSELDKNPQIDKVRLLYNGGGNFFIIIETIQQPNFIEQIVSDYQKEIDNELKYDEFYIALSFVLIGNNFGDSWKELGIESNKKKNTKFKGFSATELFKAFDFDEKNKSDKRNRWSELTELEIFKESKNKRWASVNQFFTKWEERFETKLFGRGFSNLFEENESIESKLPKWDGFEDDFTLGVKNKVKKQKQALDSEYDLDPGEIVDFTYISAFAEERTGTAKLGILKMDVDNLGNLFSGISDEPTAKKYSNKLKRFFNEEIYKLWDSIFINQTKFSYNIYPVFAGGDDCFFVGAWDAILYFAPRINQEFRTFVEQEQINYSSGKCPTLSAGIVIVDEHFPVIQFANLAEEALEEAKKREYPKDTKLKNSITVFGEIFTWEEYNEILNSAEKFVELIKSEKASKSILGRIRQSANGYEKLYEHAKKGSLSFPRIDKLKYYLRDAKEDAKEYYKETIFGEYKTSLIDAYSTSQESDKIYSIINPMKYPVATRIAEFALRNK